MTLVISGSIGINSIGIGLSNTSIVEEVLGSYQSTDLLALQAASDPEVGSPTNVSVTDFYGHTQDEWGQCYGQSDGTRTGYIKRVTQGNTYLISTSDLTPNEKFEGNQNENVRVDRTNTGTAFIAADKCICYLYKRTKNTSGSWGSPIQTWVPPSYYLSQAYACDFDTYDYLWLIAQGM